MPLVIPLAVLLALLVSYGLATTSRPVSGGFVKWLADKVVNIPLIGGFSVEQVLRLDRFLTQALGTHFQAVSRAGVKWVATLANYVYVVGYWTLYWPIELTHVVAWLVKTHIPHAINARTKPIAKTADAAEAQAKAAAGVAHTIPKVAKGNSTTKEVTVIKRVAMPHAKHWDWINTHWKGLTAAIAVAGGLVLPRPLAWPEFRRSWKEIEVWRKATAKRLLRLEALLAASGLALAVAKMTGTKVGCWRGRGNIARTLRHICGAPSWLIDLLVIGTMEAFIVSDLCRFADELGQAAENLRPALMALVDVEDALIDCHGTVKPMDFALPSLSLPPMPTPSVLLAA